MNVPLPQILREEHISRLGLFLKRTLPHHNSTEGKKQKNLSRIFYSLSSSPLLKKYLDKNLTFTPSFVTILTRIHDYMEAFREVLPFDNLMRPEGFPLFLLQYYSTPQQQEMYQQLVGIQDIQELLQKQGVLQAKKMLESLLTNYQNSFSDKQLLLIHHTLDLGTEFQAFLRYDFTSFLIMLYPLYPRDRELASLRDTYRPVSSFAVLEELEQILSCFASLEASTDYGLFIRLYSQFLNHNIVSASELEKFFSYLEEFLGNDALLNLVRFQKKDELFFVTANPLSHCPIRFSHIMDHVVLSTQQKQKTGRLHYMSGLQDSLLTYLFDKPTIFKIQENQATINQHIKQSAHGQSFSSLCSILVAFDAKIFTTNILPNLRFLFKHALFLLPEFKQDLLFYIKSISNAFAKAKENFQKTLENMDKTAQNTHAAEISARTACLDFVTGSQGLLQLLKTVIHVGKEDLNHHTAFVVSKETLQKLLDNLHAAHTLIDKVVNYIQTSLQVITVL